MLEPLDSRQKRQLKSLAQKLDATVMVGKAGLTDSFIAGLSNELERHELVKVKFVNHKDTKRELAPQMADRTSSHFVWMIGQVAVFYRQNADAEKRRIKFE